MQSARGEFFVRATRFLGRLLVLALAYFLLDVFVVCIICPSELTGLWFSAVWALLLASLAILLPRRGGQIFFGIAYGAFLIWSMAQTGYYTVFSKLMWLQDLFYIGEGVGYFGDTLRMLPTTWYAWCLLLIGLLVLLIWKFPRQEKGFLPRIPFWLVTVCSLCILCILPQWVFLKDSDIGETDGEYGQSSSYRATYETMYDAERVYSVCGLYQLTVRDFWIHEIYPHTSAYARAQKTQVSQIDAYFSKRSPHQDNEMTGIYKGKNVVLVLMESMDDWLITPTETPTLYKLMQEGIHFTQFYTPGYGTARTLNTEFCLNSGLYLPTTGDYVFDYISNDFNESLASQVVDNGYSAEVFHYNTAEYYNRGIMEPTLGYETYHSYGDYIQENREDQIYDDCMLFDIPELKEQFFREGRTFNTIITRAAHMAYHYDEALSQYAFSIYPEYCGKYESEAEDCIRVKAKLVEDMFARLLQELEAEGCLEDTVIIGITDHYAYGFRNEEKLMQLSNVEEHILLERTPCFVWSADGPSRDVDKTLNTSDFLPTVLNLLGIESPYHYLGQDAFDPNYDGYALFPDGSWIRDGVACRVNVNGEAEILSNPYGKELSAEYLTQMDQMVRDYIHISNLLLTSDYYRKN